MSSSSGFLNDAAKFNAMHFLATCRPESVSLSNLELFGTANNVVDSKHCNVTVQIVYVAAVFSFGTFYMRRHEATMFRVICI